MRYALFKISVRKICTGKCVHFKSVFHTSLQYKPLHIKISILSTLVDKY